MNLIIANLQKMQTVRLFQERSCFTTNKKLVVKQLYFFAKRTISEFNCKKVD